MNTPIKHHYLPRFYINNWNNQKGLVTVFFKDRRVLEVSSKNICFEKNLYTRREGNVEIEKEFFAKIDGKAAKAFRIVLERGISYLDITQKEHVSNFIDTLQARSPELLNPIKEFVEQRRVENEIWAKKHYEEKGVDHREVNKPDMFCDSPYLLKLHSKGEDYRRILNSYWYIFENRTRKDFITSDSPLAVFSLSGPDRIYKLPDEFLLTLPLTPRKVLIISSKQNEIKQHIGNEKTFVVETNVITAQNAQKLIISKDRDAEKFIFKIWDNFKKV